MAKRFKVGDHVRWNSEAGHVSGHIIRVHTRGTEYKGHRRHASDEEPQYEIRSDKTDHVAMHKDSALQPFHAAASVCWSSPGVSDDFMAERSQAPMQERDIF